MRQLLLAVCASIVLPAPAALAEGLDIKPGLWERTVTMQRPGMPQLPQMPEMSQLPPDQRARMEQMMAGMSGKPITARECVTPDMLKKWEDFSKSQTEEGCTSSVTERSARRMVMSIACDGGRSTGTMQLDAPSPERLDGSMSMLSHGEDGSEQSTRMQIASKWLGADCGALAPEEPQP